MKSKWKNDVHLLEKVTVDRTANVIRGVKLLGYESRNSRVYTEKAADDAAKHYEGSYVNLNHLLTADDRKKGRQVEQRFGKISSALHKKGQGVYGDLTYNPKHPNAEQILWWAENDPSALGMSHDADGHGHKMEDGRFKVEGITSVEGVDLVARPATTNGLFESVQEEEEEEPMAGEKDLLESLTLEQFKSRRPDLFGKVQEDTKKSLLESDTQKAKDLELKEAKDKVDKFQKRLDGIERSAQAKKLCADNHLPEEAVSEVFMTQLLEAKDETTMKVLIEDRYKLLGGKKVESAGGRTPEPKKLDEGKKGDESIKSMAEMPLEGFLEALSN